MNHTMPDGGRNGSLDGDPDPDATWLAAAEADARRRAGGRPAMTDDTFAPAAPRVSWAGDERLRLIERAKAAGDARYAAVGSAAVAAAELAAAAAQQLVVEHEEELGRTVLLMLTAAAKHLPGALVGVLSGPVGDHPALAGSAARSEQLAGRVANLERVLAAAVGGAD